MQAILGRKQTQTQKFLSDGTRIPVTFVEVKANPVLTVKTQDRDGYVAVQLGYGVKKHANKAALGHSKKGANLDHAPYFLAEIRLDADIKVDELPKPGEMVNVSSVFEPGDMINVTGISKGKGFAGGVKRYHFKGGPRTHGQSDRERAPGSIGQTTTPGRVYKGKHMAGKMGFERVTVRNLEVAEVLQEGLLINGLVPGIPGGYLVIKKVGKNKKFNPLFKEEVKTEETVKEKDPAKVEKPVKKVEKKSEGEKK